MLGLLIKDFKLLKTQKTSFLVLTAIPIIAAATSEDTSFASGFLISFLGTISYLFILSTISYDEFDNGNAFLFSLPITRRTYVLEKYVFGLLIGGALWLLGTLISILIMLFRNSGSFINFFEMNLPVLPLLVVGILSFMLPFRLKFDSEKYKIVILTVIGCLVLVGFVIVNVVEKLNLDSILLWQESALPLGILGVFVLAVLFLVISIKISIAIVNRKEF